ncbi:chitinase-3-like protein 1 [Physella acuta]|uniref:chitinase-3-like protein 1 n=1 Tax=Physella acuta TaxID=109671 RepID=UPI0027DDF5E7|nr:chitinase-3-like protein 1 [Physella acuta]
MTLYWIIMASEVLICVTATAAQNNSTVGDERFVTTTDHQQTPSVVNPDTRANISIVNITDREIKDLPTAASGNTIAGNRDAYSSRLKRVVCNIDASAATRDGTRRFLLHSMAPNYCSDIYYSYTEISDDTERFIPSRSNLLPLNENEYFPNYITINDFKVKMPNVQTFLTVIESSGLSYESIVSDVNKLEDFTQACRQHLRLWGFDGLVIHWLYPPEARQLTTLLRHLKMTFYREVITNSYRLQIGVVLAGFVQNISQYYEVGLLNNFADQITLLTFNPDIEDKNRTQLLTPLYPARDNDQPVRFTPQTSTLEEVYRPSEMFEGAKTNKTGYIDSHYLSGLAKRFGVASSSLMSQHSLANLTAQSETRDDTDRSIGSHASGKPIKMSRQSRQTDTIQHNTFSIDSMLKKMIDSGADKSKVNVVISLVGQSFLLKDRTVAGLNAPAIGVGTSTLSDKTGHVFYYEMCQRIKNGTNMRASFRDLTPFWYLEKEWVTYEDERSITQKIEYLKEHNIGGLMISSQSEDDFSGAHCNKGNFPLSRLAYELSNLGESDLWKCEKCEQYCSSTLSICSPSLSFVALLMLLATR